MKQGKNFLDDVVILRCIAIISMVLWHCHCSYICWGLTNTPMDKWYSLFYVTIIPDASLPLFTFLSGYLFCYLLQNGKYGNFKDFVLNKGKRLLIPYFIVGTIINLTAPQRYLSEIVWGNSCHLWYCLMLFWCFIICWCIVKVNNCFFTYTVFILSFLYVCWRGNVWNYPGFRLLFGVFHAIYYFCYFYIGFLCFKYKHIIYDLMKHWLWLLLLLFICASLAPYLIHVNTYSALSLKILLRICIIIRTFGFTLILWTIVNILLDKDKLHMNKWIREISYYSFGIYIFHEWIAWDICHIPYVISIMNTHYILFPILFSILNFIVSFYLTKYVLMTKVGKFLIG